jgi:transposase
VDATGLEARHVSVYYRMRRGESKRRRHRRRAWPKLTAVVHLRSHLVIGVVTGRGPTQDSPAFTPALRQAVRVLPLDTVLGDAGYDAEHNHRLCREGLGVRLTVINLNPRNTGRRWPATPYRREMRRRFPRELYHQRWQIESAFSRLKRRLRSALTARTTRSHAREVVLRVLTHNLMILRRCALRISTEHGTFKGKPLSRTKSPQWPRLASPPS